VEHHPPGSADDLARRVAAALTVTHTDLLAAALAACVRDPASYEASVRGGGGAPRAGRMMIERASPQVVDAVAQGLGVVLPPVAAHWMHAARQAGVPIIAGWDRRGGGGERCVKLYVNASDASEQARTRLRAVLVASLPHGHQPPAVLGLNVRADGLIETKLYRQSADAMALAEGVGARPATLAAAARAERADAGGVLSYDVRDGDLYPRAFFVALREPRTATTWSCVGSLPGYEERALAPLLPFVPAPPRSVGVSLGNDAWTVYYKPRGSGRAPEALEPVAVFRTAPATRDNRHTDAVEVGVFVEPVAYAERAFRRTERSAVSVRVRQGAPEPRTLEALVDWFTSRLRRAEADGRPLSAYLTAPPPPWQVVESGEE